MNKEKLEKEIGEMHDNLNKSMALLRGMSAYAYAAVEDDQITAISDVGLTAEIVVKILQEDVYQRLERLPKAIEEKGNE